jgi:Fe-S cluster assembly protein SufD
MMTKTLDLAALREQAWKGFTETAAPAKTVETWRRLSFSEWALGSLSSKAPAPLSPIKPEDRARVEKVGGKLLPLEEAVSQYPELVGPFLEKEYAGADFKKLETANRALWRGGVFLHVPRGVRLEDPVDVGFEHSGAFSFPRLLVVLEDGAEAAVVERHLGGAEDGRSSAFSHVRLGRDARLRFFYAQELPKKAVHFWHQRIELGQSAELSHSSIMLGGRRHKSELDVRLEGRGARSNMRGVVLGGEDQFFDPHTHQRHLFSDTASDMLFRTALKANARAIYTGLVRIEKDALDCEAFQSNHNLVLSDEARADSTPILEILPDRVACKHGATAGPLDANEIFYLQTRGIPEEEAKRMLIMGFFEPVLSAVPIPSLRSELAERVADEVGA